MTRIVIQQPAGSASPSVRLENRSSLSRNPGRVPFNPRTLPQQKQRNTLSAVAAQWRGLTDDQRTAWTLMGRQVPHRLSGFDLYVKVNVTLIRSGLPEVTTPPPLPAFGVLDCAGLIAEDTPSVKLLQVSSTAPADRLLVWATPPVGQGLQNVEKRFRELASVPGPTAVPVDVDLTAAYAARFGQLRARKRIFVRLFAMSNGFKGVARELSVIIAGHGG